MLYEDNYLAHFGIKGQKWGVRRFQNEDGTLTEEGKRRYYDSLTASQKKVADGLAKRDLYSIYKKMAEGKDFDQAMKEVTTREAAKGALGVAILITTASMYNPQTRALVKAAGKALVRSIKNSNLVQRGSLYLKKMLSRRDMIKKGAVSLRKSQYSVRDIPFGGYLK